ncbi:hypothetical protein ES707_14312 [subsurface metagenome]
MSRRIAKGRLVPQSRSTDPRIGRVSLKAATLYDRMWINADDQGRLPGDSDEIKYTTCPNLPDIPLGDIPGLLQELKNQKLIRVYNSTTIEAIQLLDWWHEQKLQWAYPSEFSPPEGWADCLRYHSTPADIVTDNWPPPALPSRLPSNPASTLPSTLQEPPLTTPPDKRKGKGKGKGRLPSTLGSKSSPSPTDLCTDRTKISDKLIENFSHWFGTVEARNPEEVIPRSPGGKDLAQLRDLAEELLRGGGVPLDYIRQAFREAGGQDTKSKRSVSYVRAILFDWIGVPRAPP